MVEKASSCRHLPPPLPPPPPSSQGPPSSLRTWHGVAFIRRARYGRGIFKFILTLPLAYNDVDTWPRLHFLTPVYHPLVHPQTGELDLHTFYPQWDPERHFIVTVLTLLKKIFYLKPSDYDSLIVGPGKPTPFNPEAARLYVENHAEYLRRVESCVAASQEDVFVARDGSLFQFTEPLPLHGTLFDMLKEEHDKNSESGQAQKVLIPEMLRKLQRSTDHGGMKAERTAVGIQLS
ncbi:ubiquitin-conjugating enzyme domain-containing protein [Nannochloropsis gaditana]|uniref:Ubiquitin-conjugating enzyme domain-containing protein n=1 Tax=Nannochloropsis gaditana TaxID=72520 RepID=W7TTL9_9STRA|nr:ubiquitin-conjugating enzyme domain-containing protein [Nannochloropsis gaditana]